MSAYAACRCDSCKQLLLFAVLRRATPTSSNSHLSKGYIGAHRPTLSIFAAADLDELLDI